MTKNARSKEKIPLRDRIRQGLWFLFIMWGCWQWINRAYTYQMDFLSVALGILIPTLCIIIAGSIYYSSWRDYLKAGWIKPAMFLAVLCISTAIMYFEFVRLTWVVHGLPIGTLLGFFLSTLLRQEPVGLRFGVITAIIIFALALLLVFIGIEYRDDHYLS